jgi:hypothetical protein
VRPDAALSGAAAAKACRAQRADVTDAMSAEFTPTLVEAT